MKHYFMQGPIKDSKCWAGQGGGKSGGGKQMGNERHFSRLIYCLTFLHSTLNERAAYGTRGGFSKRYLFSAHDLFMATHYVEVCNIFFRSAT